MTLTAELHAKLDFIPEGQLIRLEELPCYDNAIARLMVGTRWKASTGREFCVIEHDRDRPGYVNVECEYTRQTYWWHVKSILETTMVRLSCDLTV